jgi:hypothetical protein
MTFRISSRGIVRRMIAAGWTAVSAIWGLWSMSICSSSL